QETELQGETEVAPPSGEAPEHTAEVSGAETSSESPAVGESDGDNYIENYPSSPSMPSFKPNNDELPSLESTLTKKTSLEDHLVWQLKLAPFPAGEGAGGHLVI